MNHIIDILSIGIIGLIASSFLIKTFHKVKSGCSSGICSNCDSACNTKIKQFQPKTIKITKID